LKFPIASQLASRERQIGGAALERFVKGYDIPKGCMLTLYHHAFCPHSRFVRLVAGEYGFDLRLVE